MPPCAHASLYWVGLEDAALGSREHTSISRRDDCVAKFSVKRLERERRFVSVS